MSLTNTPQAQLRFQKMRHTQARQETAANNMARAGVSGANAKEVAPFKKAVRQASSASIKTTNVNHMSGKSTQTGFQTKRSKSQGEASTTGNTISAEEQLLALNEASTDFYRAIQISTNEKSRARTIAGLGGGK